MLKKTAVFFLLCFFVCSNFVFAIPEFRGFVNDYEEIIENVDELEQKISNFEKETSIEIAVLTTSNFEDTYIEDYAVQVFEKWGIGKADGDNGVLLVVSKEQREMRIEVGYGLEPIITDSIAGRIRDQAILPSFREENYTKGVNDGVDMIIKILGGEEVDGVTTNFEQEDDMEALGCLGIMFMAFLLLIPNPFVAAIVGAIFGFFLGFTFFGITGGTLGAIVGGILGFVFGLLARMIPAPVRQGIVYSMISRGGRSGGSRGGFGGFGGGSSGGGGASGRW